MCTGNRFLSEQENLNLLLTYFVHHGLWHHLSTQTRLINPVELIRWNMDKHYLQDLEKQGIHTPPAVYIHSGENTTLGDLFQATGWVNAILKPTVPGGGRTARRGGS